jgi:hypothetical protein
MNNWHVHEVEPIPGQVGAVATGVRVLAEGLPTLQLQ